MLSLHVVLDQGHMSIQTFTLRFEHAAEAVQKGGSEVRNKMGEKKDQTPPKMFTIISKTHVCFELEQDRKPPLTASKI